MIIKIDDTSVSNVCIHYLDCFRFQIHGNEYDVFLNKIDIELYQYEIWKKEKNNLTFVKNVSISLKKFREYYFADERSTNYKIVNELIIPKIIEESGEKS